MPKSAANPWVGIGFGYEWLSWSFSATGAEVSFTTHGFELANLMAGLDFEITEHFYLGPALSFSFGQYSEVGVSCSDSANDACEMEPGQDGPNIESKALHEWLVLAVRGAYAP